MEWEDDHPLEYGHPTANLSNCPQLNSSQHSGTASLLSFSASPLCRSAALSLFGSSGHLLLEPGVWGLYMYRLAECCGSKCNIWARKKECLFPFRVMGFQAWERSLCQETNLFYPVFPCLLSISIMLEADFLQPTYKWVLFVNSTMQITTF